MDPKTQEALSVYREIELDNGTFAIVDDEDYELLSGHSWFADGKGYAYREFGIGRYLSMHREVLGDRTELEVNHINGDKLDNRRQNLRLATRSQNNWNRGKNSNNTSGYKGVHRLTGRDRWEARIGVCGDRVFLGTYTTPKEAHAAYCVAAEKYHGEFAKFQ